MKDILNVVVGAGLPSYFTNCLMSLSKYSGEDTVAYYNYVDGEDQRRAHEIRREYISSNIKFNIQENVTGLRTGSLYRAYNDALEAARGRYRYISFIQADMQMMWWDQRIVERCDEIMDSADDQDHRDICFYTQLPVRGKRNDYYSPWKEQRNLKARAVPGIVDVGIFPLEHSLGNALAFRGSERTLSEACAAAGSVVALHPFPFLAPIPFPHTMRDRSKGAIRRSSQYRRQQYLRLAPDFSEPRDFSQPTFHPIFMEDVVWPNGWSSLTPYWPSDTRGTAWLRNRIVEGKLSGAPLWAVQSGRGLSRFPRGRFRPGVARTLATLMRLMARETFLMVRRTFSSSAQSRPDSAGGES